MRPTEVKGLIVKLLSSARTNEDPRDCFGLSCRQICNHIESLLAPEQVIGVKRTLWVRVEEQLEILESEFEVASKGKNRKTYKMSPPTLIIEREAPLRARYVGDRAYFNTVVVLLGAACDNETWLIETLKTVEESREILEARGISVQSEQMLFQFLSEPTLPTDIELAMAEQLYEDDIGPDFEVYIPRRMDFFANRWVGISKALPSAMSQLCRVKNRSFLPRKNDEMYIWKAEDCYYRLSKDQAMIASYRIDLDRNESRLLDLDSPIPARIRSELPVDYRALLDRYTAQVKLDGPIDGRNSDKQQRYLEVKFKYKVLLKEILERLGINKPLA